MWQNSFTLHDLLKISAMKKLYVLLVFMATTLTQSQIINFADPDFKSLLLTPDSSTPGALDQNGLPVDVDVNDDGEIDQSEALAVYGINLQYQPISDLGGIEYFTNVTKFDSYFTPIANVNFTSLVNLVEFKCNYAGLLSLQLPTGIQKIDVSVNDLTSIDVSSFTNLIELNIESNQIQNLDLSNNINLDRLLCSSNPLTSINFGSISALTHIECSNNLLDDLFLENLINLKYLDCSSNSLEVLNIGTLTQLETLKCSLNDLVALDITNKEKLVALYCNDNNLQQLDFTGTGSSNDPEYVFYIDCSNNNFSSLDFTVMGEMPLLVNCGFNPMLETISIKNGRMFSHNSGFRTMPGFVPPPLPVPGIYFEGNPNLNYICTDEYNIDYVQEKIVAYGYTECVVNSYCNFTPGEDFYSMMGVVMFDDESNGCDTDDVAVPDMKLEISDGTQVRTFFSNNLGTYSIPALSGTYTLTPVFENPSLFSISPANVTVTFPDAGTPIVTPFCISPVGTHSDLEVVIVPLNVARPGFDSQYKIVYKNKGNTIQSGSLSFVYDDYVMDLILSVPVAETSGDNTLGWTFSGLLPFQSDEILVKFNLNSPMETPPLNSGDFIDVSANVVGNGSDDTPSDNTSELHQPVQNSLDPNDKACLEGETVSTSVIGDYVHYLIRFENTGTFAAQNVVIRDIIEAEKFDISTLVPMSSSHPMETRILTGNRVEFIFENINLPFDDEINDGHVAFKIKTLSTLQPNDTFSNTAEIFFDFNFPVLTNTATSTIQLLNNPSSTIERISIYPNPAGGFLNLSTEVASAKIYNLLGQMIFEGTDVSGIDVSILNSGNYILRIELDGQIESIKFIKL